MSTSLPKALHAAIGIRVRAHRKAAGVRQQDLAAKTGLSASQVSRLETAGSGSLDGLLRVAWALGVEPGAMLPDLEDLQDALGKVR